MNIYLAAPLFTPEQLKRNKQITEKLRKAGYAVYLPQEHGLLKDGDDAKTVWKEDLKGLYEADVVVALLDDDDPGTAWECGFAYRAGVQVVGYCSIRKKLNNMLVYGCKLVHSQILLMRELASIGH